MNDKQVIEQLCSAMIKNAVESRIAPNDWGFSGAAHYSQNEINSAMDNASRKGLGRIDQQICNEIHDLTFHGTRSAILNLEQARFVNRHKDIGSTFED